MSETPDTAEAPEADAPEPTDQAANRQQQELTLDQLHEHITRAEAEHKDLSVRLDSIPRD
ncbi:MAG: hypothetical protein ACTMHH_05160 [Nesterenkonia sp.]